MPIFSSYPAARIAASLLLALALLNGPRTPAQSTRAHSINEQPVLHVEPPPVDINQASAAQLARIPGITPIYAQRIVSGRPYHTKYQLKTKGILPAPVYDAVKARLVAHRIK